MSNLSLIIGMPIGILGFLFLFWRRLKEDYTSNLIFSFGFLIIAFMIIGFVIGFFLKTKIPVSPVFNPRGLWFWGAFAGGGIGLAFVFLTPLVGAQFKPRFFETLEALVLGFLFWFVSVSLFSSPLFSIFTAALFPLFYFLNKKYKTFTWYKSGKIGFAGLSIFGIFFLMRSIVALISPSMIFLTGRGDAIVGSILSFIFFISLYNLSEK